MSKGNQRLLYQGCNKIPKGNFSNEELSKIFKQIFDSEDYWKTKGYADWGLFFKWRDFSLVATMLLLGLRPKEACCLRFDDIDFKTNWVFIDGKNNKCKKDRRIPLPKKLSLIFREYLSRFPKQRFWKGSNYLFPSFQNPHISPGRLKHIFREKVLKPLGIWNLEQGKRVPKTRLYALRHSFACRYLKKQTKKFGIVDLHSLANLMGHSDIRSTQTYLISLLDDDDYGKYLKEQMEL